MTSYTGRLNRCCFVLKKVKKSTLTALFYSVGSYTIPFIMDDRIQTPCGTYIGRKEDGIISFKGVRYAKPPVGDVRWMPPEPPQESDADIEALDFGPAAMQDYDELEYASHYPMSEDCLSLNIWVRTETVHTRRRPVMVFIHGGACISGGSVDPLYDGANFVRRNDIVLVTINYRLNIFGFLDLEEFGGNSYRYSKNLGILDQIQALRWIKEHIVHFGGDPDNITLFGESAGSMSVSLLMTIPEARGLFHKAIAQSGTFYLCRQGRSDTYTRQVGRDFVGISGVRNMRELLTRPAEELLGYYRVLEDIYGDKYDGIFEPVLDGDILPVDPLDRIASGCAAGIKLLIGSNADEMKYWSLYYPDLDDHILELMDNLGVVLDGELPVSNQLKEKYLAAGQQVPREQREYMLFNDWAMRGPAIALAERQAEHADTYMYCFAWKSNHEDLGACHAVELPFVFHNLDTPSGINFTGPRPPKALADRIQDAWVAFAKSGDPAHPGIIPWPKYEKKKRMTMIIDEQFSTVSDPRRRDRQILQSVFKR